MTGSGERMLGRYQLPEGQIPPVPAGQGVAPFRVNADFQPPRRSHPLRRLLTTLIVVVILAVVFVVFLPAIIDAVHDQQQRQQAATALAGLAKDPVIYSDPLTSASSQSVKDAQWDNRSDGCLFQDNSYNVTAYASPTKYGYVCYEQAKQFSDFAVQVDMTTRVGDFGGLIIRSDTADDSNAEGTSGQGNGYLFEVDGGGNYTISSDEGDNHTILYPWGRSSAIKTDGATNRLLVIAQDDTLIFYINGIYQTTVTDSTHTTGVLGLYSEAVYGADDSTIVAFRNLKVYRLGQ